MAEAHVRKTFSSLLIHFVSPYHKLIYKLVSQGYPRKCETLPFVIPIKTTTIPHILQKGK